MHLQILDNFSQVLLGCRHISVIFVQSPIFLERLTAGMLLDSWMESEKSAGSD